jgi:hypothetical protein
LCCIDTIVVSFIVEIELETLAGQVQEDEVVDSNVLQYCSIDKKEKKSLGEMEQEFLQALQVKKLYLIMNFFLVEGVVSACSYLWLSGLICSRFTMTRRP